jgi:hypothetical protein
MDYPHPFPPQIRPVADMSVLLFEALAAMAKHRRKAFLSTGRHRRGCRLSPGRETPLWNELAGEIRPHLRKYGDQVNLGRLLGLPRQQIHAYFINRTRMPDAERTLQFLAWLNAVRAGRRPS